MALRKSIQAAARVQAPGADSVSDTVTIVSEYLTETGLVLNDVVEMCAWPAGHVLVDATLACADSDSNGTPLIGLDVGLMTGAYLAALDGSGNARTVGTEVLSASTIARAGGMAQLATAATLLLAPASTDRSLGIKVQAAAATLTVGAKWRLVAVFAPAPVSMAEA